MIELPDIGELMDADIVPRVHGNGFIQLDLLEPDTRLHVWDRDVPKQTHQNDRVARYEVFTTETREGTEDTKLVTTHCFIDLGEDYRFLARPGSMYTFPPGVFHDSKGHGTTATIMEKTGYLADYSPRVLLPIGAQPDNEFDRDKVADPEQLWTIIDRALFEARRQLP
jgi:hypothetical protein